MPVAVPIVVTQISSGRDGNGVYLLAEAMMAMMSIVIPDIRPTTRNWRRSKVGNKPAINPTCARRSGAPVPGATKVQVIDKIIIHTMLTMTALPAPVRRCNIWAISRPTNMRLALASIAISVSESIGHITYSSRLEVIAPIIPIWNMPGRRSCLSRLRR